jgi:hypothetical protein
MAEAAAMSAIRTTCAIIGFFVLLAWSMKAADGILFSYYRLGADATDGVGVRSGLGLRTDSETGCQYLESRFGGLTPRLTADGRHLCRSVAP